jgi:putative transposase
MDISYIPMARGFVYLAAVIDWFSRRVLAWRVSISMDTAFCVECVEEAVAKYGVPEIFNTDQGSEGGFNRSSQHLIKEVFYGTSGGMDASTDGTKRDALARCAVAST